MTQARNRLSAAALSSLKRVVKRGVSRYLRFAPQTPGLWQMIERLAASAQGKGWGSHTIEMEVSSCLALLGYTPSVILDIGANKGLYTQRLLAECPSATYYLFEPAATNLALLRDRYGSFSNITVSHFALSDHAARQNLYADKPGAGTSSLTRRKLEHLGYEIRHVEEIESIRFDDFWRTQQTGATTIDYVKIDVEGHELAVLEGFGELLSRVALIQFEFGGCNIDTRTYFKDFWYFFTTRGFSIFRITPAGPEPISVYAERDEFFSTTNFIAVNDALRRG